ncbi:hypothetical protein Ngar_c18320 [Candidatus Nitrososphaera gargensis Ga9.2]|uniref:Uncharacterized protein n=1 Tax=Nitrososphaera gargensis (strain Ga9.2) TaxID=1237085 RepID=K0IG50_NITGG|nr:hypothetical protein [Candidatus Nitrososphaera gargensis]AFU58765.1 hypothetical protein Ngar_c18320 [Candidatus Nitrososphaera gargensis Ga9.2]
MVSLFRARAATALAISVAVDALDYVAAPLFATPVIGDISDAIVTSVLYAITRSKRSALINMAEFVPLVGDFVPVYTISTLMWIHSELKKEKVVMKKRS